MKTTSLIFALLAFASNMYASDVKSDTIEPALALHRDLIVSSNSSLKTLDAKTDSIDKIGVIPNDALSGNYEALFLGSDQASDTVVNKTAIEINWASLNSDGLYCLVVTPKQIYLRNFHYNPGINHLYWMVNIDRSRFDIIKKYLAMETDGIFSKSSQSKSYRESYFF